MNFLKNYFYIFVTTYFVLLATKFLFLWFQFDDFEGYKLTTLFYAILWGYKFDFAVSAIVSFLSTLVDFNKRIVVMVSMILIAIVFLIQVADVMYFDESTRHLGYEVSDVFVDYLSLIKSASSQYHYFVVFSALTIACSLYSIKYVLNVKLNRIDINTKFFGKKIFLLILSVFFIRGMFNNVPLTPWQSNQIGDAKLSVLSLNGTYNAIYALIQSNKRLKERKLKSVSDDIVKESFSYLYPPNKYEFTPKKRNIVLLFLESWSAIAMKSYGYGELTTPNFDSILAKSIRPKAMLASGIRTTEGIFAALTSFPNPLGMSVASTSLQSNSYTSLVDILSASGYSSAFFQGTAKETSGTGSLTQSLGFKHSYGKRDVEDLRFGENAWGIFDQDLYRYALSKANTMKKPFVIAINGATTHDDKLPSDTKIKIFSADQKLNRQLNALHNADEALGEFVRNTQEQYPDTLFVIFADHSGNMSGSSFEQYLIPFAIYAQDLEPAYHDMYLSQRDIAPSVLDMVLGDYMKLAPGFTGKSIISDSLFFADYYHNGTLGWVENNNLMEINLELDTQKCFDVSGAKQVKVKCDEKFSKYKEHALSFTNTSQKLLFDGKAMSFTREMDER